jgi:hypothetical protein
MVRDLPLLLGAMGTVLGLLTLLALPSIFIGLYSGGGPLSLEGEIVIVTWAVSPFLGLAGAASVRKYRKLGGLLFVIAGALPSAWLGLGAAFPISAPLYLWIPLLIVAGLLAISQGPGPNVKKENSR